MASYAEIKPDSDIIVSAEDMAWRRICLEIERLHLKIKIWKQVQAMVKKWN